MHLFDLFRWLLPGRNPIGFGAGDFIELGLGFILVMLALARAWVEPGAAKLAQKTGASMLLLFTLVVALRLALLPSHPAPTPAGADDFSYLLLGDTLAHFRLTNPPHPMHRFFETTFVLQSPTYSSIYPLGPALVLAAGQLAFRLPWAGVLLSMALLCALIYWMLRGWTTPGWALAGGLLAVCEFGPLCSWMNLYWGGAVSGIAGCLVFGALPRLEERFLNRDAILLGAGLGLQLLSRPFESLLLDLCVVLFFLPLLRSKEWAKLTKTAAIVMLMLAPTIALLLAHNRAVTGSWTTMPYSLSRYQYGVPTTFTFQPNPTPHTALTPVQELYYEGQAAVHGDVDTVSGYFKRLLSRASFYRFFFLAPLYLALPFFLLLLRKFRMAWVALTILLFALGTNFYPYFFPHYIAAVTCLFVLVPVLGLERLSKWTVNGRPAGQIAAQWILLLCGTHFLFWYGVHALGDRQTFEDLVPQETADFVNFGDPAGRIAINRQLAATPGRLLVFVRYYSTHGYHEWIHNAADIDHSRVVMALELNPDDNERLERYYPDRSVWLLEPDAEPPNLIPYPESTGPFLRVK